MIKSNKTDRCKRRHQKGKLKRQEKRGLDQSAHSWGEDVGKRMNE
jgi:hypothetical protein